jgi:hypothetical protein
MTALVHDGAVTHLIEWLFGDDTGISSKSMAAVALGVTKTGRREFGAPHDPSDFGRCYRLVLAVPEIIDAFPAISKRVPVFTGILENWDELCALYERDLPTGRSNDLYNRIKELRGETRRIGGAA